jgi:hypothetical protein
MELSETITKENQMKKLTIAATITAIAIAVSAPFTFAQTTPEPNTAPPAASPRGYEMGPGMMYNQDQGQGQGQSQVPGYGPGMMYNQGQGRVQGQGQSQGPGYGPGMMGGDGFDCAAGVNAPATAARPGCPR